MIIHIKVICLITMKFFIFMLIFIMCTVLTHHLANAGLAGSKHSRSESARMGIAFETKKEAASMFFLIYL